MDRFALYAYEANGNDIDTDKLKNMTRPKPQIVEWDKIDTDDSGWAVDLSEESDEATVLKLAEDFAKKAEKAEKADLPIDDSTPLVDENGEPVKKKRRRRRRGKGRSESDTESGTDNKDTKDQSDEKSEKSSESKPETESKPAPELDENGEPIKKKRRRRRGGRNRSRSEGDSADNSPNNNPNNNSESKSEKKSESKQDKKPEPIAEPKPRRRGLYSGGRRKLSSAEIAAIDRDV